MVRIYDPGIFSNFYVRVDHLMHSVMHWGVDR